jgi:exodeoxyribonuclease VII large subunit
LLQLQILTVTELTTYLRELIDADEIARDVWVEGEVSNFNRHSSGHCYFTMKEGETQLGAACWRSYVARIGAMPANGAAILAHGRVAFYEGRGQLQLIVDDIRPAGIGLLQAQFERLKARLDAEGLFDPSRKRPLPALPHRIGIATSPTSAALQDILHILGRRYPLAEVIIAPCKVQGAGAADSVVEALYTLYEANVDVIIVARGGGSAEDLWTFNEESVARAVFASPVPLVSGVGHETDTTMIDYVADLRAPTPSAAAELVTPDRTEMSEVLDYLRERLDQAMDTRFAMLRNDLDRSRRRLELRSPLARIGRDRQFLDETLRRAEVRIGHRILLERAKLDGMQARLTALSPKATLERGYAVVRKSDGHVVTQPEHVTGGEVLIVTVRGGDIPVRVE